MDRQDLAERIASLSLLRGEFTLRSGKTSSYYLDKYLFSTRPDVLRDIGVLFAERIRGFGEVDLLAGAELGGIPLVTVASLETGLPCVFVRNAKKDYGTSKQVEGRIGDGDRVVFVEDVTTTGGQSLEAVGVLRSLGATVAGVITTIDREEGARSKIEEAGVRFESLFTKTDLGV